MNRRKPPLRLAVVPLMPGADKRTAVLRKVAAMALEALAEQVDGTVAEDVAPFIAGYALGFARHVAMKHDIDCEALDAGQAMHELAAETETRLSSAFGVATAGIGFGPREASGMTQRARIRLTSDGGGELADAGYLVGQLEAMCGARKLVRMAILRLRQGEEGAWAFVTDCDVAADRMQSHLPTTSLRLDSAERSIVVAALSPRAATQS